MAFNSREMVVASAAAGDSFRICHLDDGTFVGRAYTRQDVETLRKQAGVSTVRWAPGGQGFPGGENVDEVVAKLSNDLRESNERLQELKTAGGSQYADELEKNVQIGQELLRRVCHLAHIEL